MSIQQRTVFGRRSALLGATGLALSQQQIAWAVDEPPAFEPPPVALARLVTGDTVKAAEEAKEAAKAKKAAAEDAKDAKEARLAAAKAAREEAKAAKAAARSGK